MGKIQKFAVALVCGYFCCILCSNIQKDLEEAISDEVKVAKGPGNEERKALEQLDDVIKKVSFSEEKTPEEEVKVNPEQEVLDELVQEVASGGIKVNPEPQVGDVPDKDAVNEVEESKVAKDNEGTVGEESEARSA